MARLTVTIDLDNEAFLSNLSGALTHVLQQVPARVSHSDAWTAGADAGTLQDSNGNTCGVWDLKVQEILEQSKQDYQDLESLKVE